MPITVDINVMLAAETTGHLRFTAAFAELARVI
jgi:hypothetical protein